MVILGYRVLILVQNTWIAQTASFLIINLLADLRVRLGPF